MDKKIEFTKIAKFRMDGKTFVRFNNIKLGDAFLKVNDEGKYVLPSTEEFAKITSVFYKNDKKDIFQMSFDLKNNHKKFKFIPKLNHKGKALVITSAIALSLVQGCGLQDVGLIASSDHSSSSYIASTSNDYSDHTSISDYYVESSDNTFDPYDIDNYNSEENATRPFDVTYEGDTYIKVNNSELFTQIFGKEKTTLDELYKVIDSNKNLPKEYKEFMKQYYTELYEYYGGIELRVYEHNLKDVEFEKKPKDEISWDLKSDHGCAYWDSEENKIVVSDDFDYENNPWDLVVMRHELAHLGNYFYIKDGEYCYKYQFKTSTTGEYAREAMDVIFSTEPYMEYYDSVGQDNLGYPLISNEMRVIVDCIDYNPKDSIDHNVYYLEHKMDEVMGDELDAHVIMNIIDMQQMENQDQCIQLDEQEYVDLYTYITKLYMTKYVNESMSYSEIEEAKETLKARLLKAVHNPEYVYTNVIDDVFNAYCVENNISQGLSK